MDFDAVVHGILKIWAKLCILLATLEVFMAESIHKPDDLISVAEQIEELLRVLSGNLSVICTCNEGHRGGINDWEINFLYKNRNVGIGICINSERNVLLWIGTTHRIDAKVFKGLVVLDILIIAHGIEA